MTKFFTVLKLSRDDFAARNWDAREVSDEEMKRAASRIGNSLLDGVDFWLAVDCQAEEMGLDELELAKVEEALRDSEDVESAEEALKQFGEIHFCDEKIDDGCDDPDDEYVMMRSYDLKGEKSYYIRIFYGNNTMKIGFYDVDEQDD